MDSRHYDLLGRVECVDFFDWKRFAASGRIQYPSKVPIKKKPPATESQGASFSRTVSAHGAVKPQFLLSMIYFGKPVPTFPDHALVGEFAADDVAEQIPLLALEAHHLKLLDRGEVGCCGVDLHARQQGV